MPDAWSDKDERTYEHIKASALERGIGEDQAEEIAARTVNKHRRLEGRTPNKRTMGTGNPNTSLEAHTVDELRNQAKALDIPRRSSMKKADLIRAIEAKS